MYTSVSIFEDVLYTPHNIIPPEINEQLKHTFVIGNCAAISGSRVVSSIKSFQVNDTISCPVLELPPGSSCVVGKTNYLNIGLFQYFKNADAQNQN